jgi:hypothetical protein
MSDQSSHRILGIIYFNPDDSRILVPMRSKLGLTINFGHPHAVTAFSWLVGIYLLGLTVAPIIAHPHWFAREPSDLVWLVSSDLVALVLLRCNGWFRWADYRLLYLASFGLIAAGIGFAVQALINGPLVWWWGRNLTLAHHLVLGPVAAVAQTFGKWFALTLLLQVRPSSSPARWRQYGLLVGFGFTLLEITGLYFRVAWAQVPVSYLSIWERASSSMFHIYSSGLVAVAITSRRFWPILLVVAVHAVSDVLAGAGGTLGLSTYTLESIFSGCALVIWVAFLLARDISRDDLSEKEIQLDGAANESQPIRSEKHRTSPAAGSGR